MKMNIKTRAALEMAKMMTFGAVCAGLALLAIEYLTVTIFVQILALGSLCYVIYALYTITLSRLEAEERLKDRLENIDKKYQ